VQSGMAMIAKLSIAPVKRSSSHLSWTPGKSNSFDGFHFAGTSSA
jgi:hypothetical protein